MQSTIKIMLLAGIIMLFGHLAKAQDATQTTNGSKDYVITVQGDTVQCDLYFPMFGGPRYTLNGDVDASEKISIDKIKEFYYSAYKLSYQGVFYNPSGKKSGFLPLLERGKINLYQPAKWSSAGIGVVTAMYISKGSNRVDVLKMDGYFGPRDDRKNDFEKLIEDNKDVYDRYMAKEKFNDNFIRSLVHLYNTGVWIADWFENDNK